MKLTYQTGVATLIQFITLGALTFINETYSAVTTCSNNSGNCADNLLSSLLFFLLVAIWFGAVWLLGLTAQDKRSKRLAQLLIGAELLIALVAVFNIKHRIDALSLITSLLDLALAIWIITLAIRLIRSGGARIVGRPRNRRRPSGHLS